jgi:hypothetical protein
MGSVSIAHKKGLKSNTESSEPYDAARATAVATSQRQANDSRGRTSHPMAESRLVLRRHARQPKDVAPIASRGP